MKIITFIIIFFLYGFQRCGCEFECPMFHIRNQDKEVVCVENCPKLYTYEDECVDTCNKDFPKLYNKAVCVQNCSFNNMYTTEEGLDCLDGCPSNKTFYLKDELICYEKCPANKNGECIVFTLEEKQSELNIILPILIPFFVLLILLMFYYLYKKKPRLIYEMPEKKHKTIYVECVKMKNKAIKIKLNDEGKSMIKEDRYKKTQEIKIDNLVTTKVIKLDFKNEEENNSSDYVIPNERNSEIFPIKNETNLIQKWKDDSIFYEIKKINSFNLTQFQLKKGICIGKGGEGNIYLVQNKYNEKFAYKCFAENVDQIDFTSKEFKRLENELVFFEKLKHPLILYAHGVIYEKEKERISFGIKVDLMDLDLRKFIKENKNSSYKTKTKICIEIINALIFIHQQNVVHNDLKPENVLLKKGSTPQEFTVRISDFGCAQIVQNEANLKGITYLYASPEYLLSSLESSESPVYKPNLKNDIWAFGLIIYELFVGEFYDKIPYLKIFDNLTTQNEESFEKLKFSIYENQSLSQYLTNDIFQNVENKNIKTIIDSCLQIDPKKRPNAFEIRGML